MGGIEIGNIMFGYTYDMGLSIKTYNDGTYRIFLGAELEVIMQKHHGKREINLFRIQRNINDQLNE